MLLISLLVMNRLNQTDSAIFFSLVHSLIPKDSFIQNLFISIAAGVVPCGGSKKSPRTSS